MPLFFGRKNQKDKDDGFEIAEETEPEEEQEPLQYHPMPEGVNVPKTGTKHSKNPEKP